MYVVIEMPERVAECGVYHTRANGDFVEELFSKDATIICRRKKEYLNDFSEKMAFFLIDCESRDVLKYNNHSTRVITTGFARDVDKFYRHSVKMAELFTLLYEKCVEFPEFSDKILKENLSILFYRFSGVNLKGEGYDGADILGNFSRIAGFLGKKLNDYVIQDKVDNFLLSVIRSFDLEQYEKIHERCELGEITASPEVDVIYGRVKERIELTKKMAAELIGTKDYRDIVWEYNKKPFCHFFMTDTPCGDVGIHVEFVGGFKPEILVTGKFCKSPCHYSIAEQCQKHKYKFYNDNGEIRRHAESL